MVDPWDAFGDSSEEDDEENSIQETQTAASAVAAVFAHRCLRSDASARLQYRRILFVTANAGATDLLAWKDAFYGKQMSGLAVVTQKQLESDVKRSGCDATLFDAVVWLPPLDDHEEIIAFNVTFKSNCLLLLVPGGYVIFNAISATPEFSEVDFDLKSVEVVYSNTENDDHSWKAIQMKSCKIATESCSWLSQKHSTVAESQLLADATVALTAHERLSGTMSAYSIRRAVNAVQQYGYCLVSGLLHGERQNCLDVGAAALQDLHAAAAILLAQDGVDLYQPAASTNDPATYRELSMREDRRMDLRHGPALRSIRGGHAGSVPVTIRSTDSAVADDFLRGNANILSIVRRVMNPLVSQELSAGNFGRYNFDGEGPDGSYQNLMAGVVGGIVSLPGCADQAIHADTPHLFENSADPMPAHYINVFTPGCPAVDHVGQTAFVHGSHRLDFVAAHCNGSNSGSQFDPSIWKHLVRPRLNVGDVLLFDCRILHFGLANRHATVERPLLYTNLTMHWFHDPKNWDQHKRIFKDDSSSDAGAKK